MGQVSLPVLSRKGKYDYWNYSWVSFDNYSLNFSEDVFLKKFFFLVFMYGISTTKTFLPMYYITPSTVITTPRAIQYNLTDTNHVSIFKHLQRTPKNKYFVSKIFLCRHFQWLYIYIYIYSITNLRRKILKKKYTQTGYCSEYFYSIYLNSKYKYLYNPSYKR